MRTYRKEPSNKRPIVVLGTLTTILLLLKTSMVLANTGQPLPYTDQQNSGEWRLLTALSDEFEGKRIDRDKWIVQGEDNHYENNFTGRAPSQFVPHAVSIENGNLIITTRWEPNYPLFLDKIHDGRKYENITTGAVISKAKFKYGYMESRSKAADGPISSSFWTTGKNGEIDVFEHWGHNPKNIDSGYRLHTSFHDWRDPKSKTWGKRIWTNEHKLDSRVADNFHVYGLQWAPNFVKIFFDGHLINCISREKIGDNWVATNEQKVWLDSEVFPWETGGQALTADDYPEPGRQYIIDYVRIWQTDKNQGSCKTANNLLSNNGFEDGLNTWQTNNKEFSVEPGKGVDNSNALFLSNKNKVFKKIKVKPNTKYILSGWLNNPGTNMKNIWHNSWIGVKGDISMPPSSKSVKNNGQEITKRHFRNTYQYHSLQFTTAADASEVEIFVHNLWSAHPVLIDNLQLHESTNLHQ